MMVTTWGFHLTAPGRFERCEVARPDRLVAGEVEVELLAAGICGSDLPKFEAGPLPHGSRSPAGFPIHECVGVVRRDPARELEGRLVLAMPTEDCGLLGHYLASRAECHRLTGTWAVDGASLATATAIQPLATVLFGADRYGDVRGHAVAVVGTGPIGLLHGLVARERGARRVVGVDPRPVTDEVGRFGFDAVVRDAAELPESSFDLCIEAVGHQGTTLATAIRLCRTDGRLLAFGVPSDGTCQVPLLKLFRKRLTLLAAVSPPWPGYLAEAEALGITHRDSLAHLVSHILPVAEVQRGFELAGGTQPYRRKVVLLA